MCGNYLEHHNLNLGDLHVQTGCEGKKSAGFALNSSLFTDIIIFYFKGVLKTIIDAATAETTARTLCQMGDNLIEEETSKVYKKEKELKKGIVYS